MKELTFYSIIVLLCAFLYLHSSNFNTAEISAAIPKKTIEHSKVKEITTLIEALKIDIEKDSPAEYIKVSADYKMSVLMENIESFLQAPKLYQEKFRILAKGFKTSRENLPYFLMFNYGFNFIDVADLIVYNFFIKSDLRTNAQWNNFYYTLKPLTFSSYLYTSAIASKDFENWVDLNVNEEN